MIRGLTCSEPAPHVFLPGTVGRPTAGNHILHKVVDGIVFWNAAGLLLEVEVGNHDVAWIPCDIDDAVVPTLKRCVALEYPGSPSLTKLPVPIHIDVRDEGFDV